MYICTNCCDYKYLTKMIVYDLETAIMSKGYKREKGLILEISLISIYNTTKSFTCFVMPFLEKYIKEDELDIYFQKYGANLKPTKKHIKNIGWNMKHAVPLNEALIQVNDFIKSINNQKLPLLVAHNGRGFDHRILKGNLQKCKLPMLDVLYSDSLHDITKKTFPNFHSHSLSYLHRTLCKNSNSFNWHTAYDDTLGLVEVIVECAYQECLNNLDNVWKYILQKPLLLKSLNTNLNINLDANKHKINSKTKEYIKKCFENSDIKKNNIVRYIVLSYSIDKIWKYRTK